MEIYAQEAAQLKALKQYSSDLGKQMTESTANLKYIWLVRKQANEKINM